MKKLFILLFLFCFKLSFSQTLPDFDAIKLKAKEDYKPADSIVLQASNYLFSTPFSKEDENRQKSVRFVIRWMTGTPDYNFTIDDAATKISKDNNELLGLYMAAMAKYGIENKENSTETKLVKFNTIKLLLQYCENPSNNIKMTKELRKFADANKKGELTKVI